MEKYGHSLQQFFFCLLVFVTAMFVTKCFGFEGKLYRDTANYVYSGQRVIEGTPPYTGLFDVKGPVSPLICGISLAIGRPFIDDDVLIIRYAFSLIACMSAVFLYVTGYYLFGEIRAGLFSAFTLLGCTGFIVLASSGPDSKVPLVLFEVLWLLCTNRKHWFCGGLFGSLAFFTWQPMLLLPMITIFLSLRQDSERRKQSIFFSVLGFSIPLLTLIGYFAYHHALYDFIEGFFLFHVLYQERGQLLHIDSIGSAIPPIQGALGEICRNVFNSSANSFFNGFTVMSVPIGLGLGTIVLTFIERLRQYASFGAFFRTDPFVSIFLAFPLFIIWSLIDFQGFPDFFIFLPIAALGFARLLCLSLSNFEQNESSKRAKIVFTSIFCIIFLYIVFLSAVMLRKGGLADQRDLANRIIKRFGQDVKIVSLGNPSLLVLLNKKNPDRYVFIENGVDNLIEARFPGGLTGWLQSLEKFAPDIIALGSVVGPHSAQINSWLQTNYRKIRIKGQIFYAK